MPKMNVNIALGSEELERFDRWRGETPRGVALMKLLALAERQRETDVDSHSEVKKRCSR